jgi:hypothetical protein
LFETQSSQIFELGRPLRSAKSSHNGLSAIASVMKIDPNDPIYFDLLAIMRQRIAFVEMTIPEFAELNAPLANEAKVATQA